MKSKRTLTALTAVMLVLAMLITGCGKEKEPTVNGIETDAPETDIFNGDVVDDYGNESEEETDVYIETEIDYEYDDGSLKDTVYTEGEVDVRIVFEPREYIPDANWANYAAEAVSVIAEEFSREGYNVSVADVYRVKIFDEGCIAGITDLLYMMTVDYVIHVFDDDSSDETYALDGAVLDDKGTLFLTVGNFNINGKYREEYKFLREGEINSVYGEDNPERFALAATDILNEMKDKYADADVEFDTVMTAALEEMFPVYYNVEGLTCSAWSYTYEASEEDRNIIEANVQIYTADYILGDNGIERTSEIYSHMDWMFCKTSRGYELMTWYGYDVEEADKNSALIEECLEKAKAHFMQSDTTEVPEAYLHLAREINVDLGFEPTQNHHSPGFIGYAKEYVQKRVAYALYSGYNVSSAELLRMDFISTDMAGLWEWVWTMELSYNINVWGEETDEVTGETVTFDGIISNETEGKAYLLVANYRKNAGDVEMHKFITEAEINVLYGENNPDKYILAASQYLQESKDAYIPDREYTLDEVVWLEMADMYPTRAEWDYLKCCAYTMTASEVDEYGKLSVMVIAYKGEYSLVDGKIVENGGEYFKIILPFMVDETGYTTITKSGGDVYEREKDPALIVECRKKAEAHFANHMKR